MKIGILGGGQLARMMMEECYKFGYEFHILSKEENSPAGLITKFEYKGDWNDEDTLLAFSEKCDLITLENEFIDHHKIRFLENKGMNVYPSSDIVKLVQDKLFQKEYLRKSGIPVAEFAKADSMKDIFEFVSENSYPVILKSRTMGYDGKGNFTIEREDQIEEAFGVLSKRGKLMCESFVNFEKELATQVVRNGSGVIKVYNVVETIQKDHICNQVISAREQSEDIKSKAGAIALKIAEGLDYKGVMGIEMFLNGEEILVNELAPRVHNSGHYTIEACHTSQFENHIRAILNYPPGNTEMICDNAVMINILGTRNGKAELKNACGLLKSENVFLHIYGKTETGIGRKMGHITVLNDDIDKAIELAQRSRDLIDI